jgi:uncharacterized membrane protein YhaH (DUF805 family)
MKYYKKALQNYANFSGRARRSEYWYFLLFNIIFAIAAMILDNLLGIAMTGIGYGPLYGIYALAMLIPGLSVAVRRLHDIGKSGWFLLIVLIPIIGGIWLLVLFCTEGTKGTNEYGPDPKNPDVELADHIVTNV